MPIVRNEEEQKENQNARKLKKSSQKDKSDKLTNTRKKGIRTFKTKQQLSERREYFSISWLSK